MKILITTPLYPPDIAEPAPHVKELAKRLKSNHGVSILTYGNFPEKINSVEILATSKQKPLPIRLVNFFILLIRSATGADVIYSENGASVELPVLIASTLLSKPLLLHIGDTKAYEFAQKNRLHRFIHKLIERKATAVIVHRTLPKPEILPFGEGASEDTKKYEIEWERHIGELLYHMKKYG